jgi:hypothetical protein
MIVTWYTPSRKLSLRYWSHATRKSYYYALPHEKKTSALRIFTVSYEITPRLEGWRKNGGKGGRLNAFNRRANPNLETTT